MRSTIVSIMLIALSAPTFAKDYSPTECPVVGNTTSKRDKSGKQIYHVQGGQFYEMMLRENQGFDNRRCFGTEPEAQAAGFRKSKR